MSRPTLDTASSLDPSTTGLSPPLAGLSRTVRLDLMNGFRSPNPRDKSLVWALPRSLAATCGIDFSFSSSGYLDVSVHRVPSAWLWIRHTVPRVLRGGLPHSDICGSLCICHSPQLFAAYHVFHRLSVPRHSPCALYSFTFV